MFGLTEDQIRRYSRQIILPQVGGKGQRKLLESKVLVVGAGGLGSPAALYLAAAGVGTVGLADFDAVDLSNLHRQVLHQTDDLGRPKTASAAETLRALNPDVSVTLHQERITAENGLKIVEPYDVVAEGSDNFPTKYLINDACVLLGKPLVLGAVYQFEGQAAIFVPGEGPCYRCLFPEPPPPDLIPSCQEAGVLGAVPGVIGSLQAAETLKLLLGAGETLAGRLLVFDGLDTSFMDLELRWDPDCPVCGRSPTITELIAKRSAVAYASGSEPEAEYGRDAPVGRGGEARMSRQERIAEEVAHFLGLEQRPVGVPIEEGPRRTEPAGTPRRFCILEQEDLECGARGARTFQYGDIECPGASLALGLVEPVSVDVEPRIHTSVSVVSVGPVTGADQMLFTVTPHQAMALAVLTGGIEARCTGTDAVCSEVIARVYETGRPHLSLLCLGLRELCGFREEELVVGMSRVDFLALPEAMARHDGLRAGQPLTPDRQGQSIGSWSSRAGDPEGALGS